MRSCILHSDKKILKDSSLEHCAAYSWAQRMTVPGFVTEMMALANSVKDDEEHTETKQWSQEIEF